MDGLECSEIKLSDIKKRTYDFRIESEYYKKEDLWMLSRLETANCISLKDLAEKITDGTHHTPNYVDTGIPFLSAINVKENYLDINVGYKLITPAEHQVLCRRVHPRYEDILLRKVGVGARMACVVPQLDFDFSIFVSVALIVNCQTKCNN